MSLLTLGLGGGGAGLAFVATSVLAFDQHLEVTLNEAVASLTGGAAVPSEYVIRREAGPAVLVTGVSYVGDTLVLRTTPHIVGVSYVLHIPWAGLLSASLKAFAGPFSLSYLGATGPAVTVVLSRSVDARSIEVIFNRGVNEDDASNPANYSISPTLAITKAVKVTDYFYRLTTAKQFMDETYEVTVTGVRSAA